MKIIRPFLGMLVSLLLVLHPGLSAAEQHRAEDGSGVTVHEPESRTSEIEPLARKKGSRTWLWILVGVAVVAGGAAVAAGGGGGGDDGGGDNGDTTPPPSGETGSVDVSW